METQAEKIDVLFGFDTTGSIYPVLGQIRRDVSNVISNLFKSIPTIRIGIMAIGDYCDAGNPYVIETHDLSQDKDSLVKFVKNVRPTHGGDADEAYELALHEARSLSWSAERKRVFVLIGDANPHKPDYPLNKKRLDWKNEVKMLAQMNVSIYAVHALAGYRSGSKAFYQTMANETNGYYFQLDQFENVVELIKGICSKQAGDESLETWRLEIDVSGKMNRELSVVYDTLSGKETPFFRKMRSHDSSAVKAGRFQTLMVDEGCCITDFIKSYGLIFAAGRCFYEFTKPEILRSGREVILFDKSTGETYPNATSREMMGIVSNGGKEQRIHPRIIPSGMDCFIQSTSYTRKLVPGTRLLYEVDLTR